MPLSQPPSDNLIRQIFTLTDELSEVGPLQAGPLLDSLAVARAIAVIESADTTMTGRVPGPLAGLHLDLAAGELAEAIGPDLGGHAHESAGEQVDDSTRAAAWQLVEACARTIQWHLDHGQTEHTGEQLLALTRAVLHLDAARNASRADDDIPSWP
jgi:hypothetical protein